MLIGWQHQLAGPGAAESTVVELSESSDQQVEVMEQERLMLQLKEMIRDRENALASKDAEFKASFTLPLGPAILT